MRAMSKLGDADSYGVRLPARRFAAARSASSVTTCTGSTGSSVPGGRRAPIVFACASASTSHTRRDGDHAGVVFTGASRRHVALDRRQPDHGPSAANTGPPALPTAKSNSAARTPRSTRLMVPRAVVGCRTAACRWPRYAGRARARAALGHRIRAAAAGAIRAPRDRSREREIPRGIRREHACDDLQGRCQLHFHLRGVPTTRCVVAMSPWSRSTVPDACVVGVHSETTLSCHWISSSHWSVFACVSGVVDSALAVADLGIGGRERERRVAPGRHVDDLAPLVGLALEHERFLGLDRVVARWQRHRAVPSRAVTTRQGARLAGLSLTSSAWRGTGGAPPRRRQSSP